MIDYDAAMLEAVRKARRQMASLDRYGYLAELCMVYGQDDLKFLVDMPYAQGRTWVDDAFDEFHRLSGADPVRYPRNAPPETVVALVRTHRKEQNRLRRSTPPPVPPTPGQEAALAARGIGTERLGVRAWSPDMAVLENLDTHEITEIRFEKQ